MICACMYDGVSGIEQPFSNGKQLDYRRQSFARVSVALFYGMPVGAMLYLQRYR